MDDPDSLTDPEFDRLLAEYGLDDPVHVLKVAVLIDQARQRGRIPDIAPVHIDPRRVLDLFYGRAKAVFDKEEAWKNL